MPSKILPVIHYYDDATTLRNAEVAFDAGCPGVFLINMSGPHQAVNKSARKLKEMWPDKLIGINRLALMRNVEEAIRQDIALGVDMSWSDCCGVNSSRVTEEPAQINEILKTKPTHLFFGGVAFKYQSPEPEPAKAARMATEVGPEWVITTTGSQTGSAPELNKIIAMKAAIGERSLAVASGITPQNAKPFLRYLSYILVSTGISSDDYNIDPKKLEDLMQVRE